MRHQISVEAARLLEALAVAIPKKRGLKQNAKAHPITIRFDAWGSMLRITEARHGAKGHEVSAEGSWPERVQVDGRRLRELATKFKPDAVITLTPTEDTLTVASGSFKVSFDRIDAGGQDGIHEAKFPKNKRHRGPVEVPPDPVGKRVELDATWGFSARMPVPQHRKPRE